MKKRAFLKTMFLALPLLLIQETAFGQWQSSGGDIYYPQGNVAIGTTPGDAGLEVESNNGVAFYGSRYGTGVIPYEGDGKLFLWYPGKSAFRAGFAHSNYWEDVNIGLGSAAMGYRTKASGSYSFATGYNSLATGYAATALGQNITASSDYTVAIGSSNDATSKGAVAIGTDLNATGKYTVALGSENSATASNSVAIGQGLTADIQHLAVFGRHNEQTTPSSASWNLADPLFVIGNGEYNAPSNALVVTKGGNIGIGTNTPSSKLVVAGTVIAQGLLLDANAGADFVFEDNYSLMSLEELEQFVKAEKHLPEIAPARTMKKEGVNAGEFQIQLLQKVEELTLYLIDQNKQLKDLQHENNLLKKQVYSLMHE